MSDPYDMPDWVWAAADRLYCEMSRIDEEAINDGQVEQDAEATIFTWIRLVAEIIAEEYREANT